MKSRTTLFFGVGFGVFFGLLAAGIILLIARKPQGSPLILQPAPPPQPLRIHVSGAVAQPGVYDLPAGSRVEDAVQAAGGFAEQAAQDSINLAAPLKDGGQIIVPQQGGLANRSMKTETERINLNTATPEILDKLPGIGPQTAQKIVEYREENGLFTSIEDIQEVAGIGPAIFEKIKDLIIVE